MCSRSPGLIAARLRKGCAVVPPKTSLTASAKVMSCGFEAIAPSCGMQTYSACPPNLLPNIAITSSPGENDFTPVPTASTTPATSRPRIRRRGRNAPMASADGRPSP